MSSEGKFRKIPLASLRLETEIGFSLYLPGAGGHPPVLYRGQDLTFDRSTLTRLEETGVDHLLIAGEEEAAYYRYVEANLSDVLSDTSIAMEEKCEVLYDCAQHAVQSILEDPTSGDVLPRTANLVENITGFMFSESDSLSYFLNTAAFDYKVYTHSVNVSVYSLMLMRDLGIDDPDYLARFGTGALLHDIGKSRLSPEIINCKGTLSAAQWKQMRQHPVWGWEILREHGVEDDLVLGITRFHHEKLTGDGYPDALGPDKLSTPIRAVTICDIFDALTTQRPYKDAMGSFPAFRIMQEEMKDELDPEIFATFVRLMSAQAAA